jgi:streptogramin lyase
VTIFGQGGDNRRRARWKHRTRRQRKLSWKYGPESRRLEPRALLSLSATSFPIPLVGLVQPQGITKGPDGYLWFAETGADQIGRMTSAGVLTQFALPSIPAPADPITGSPPGPVAITAGPDGALWFVGVPGEVGRITTAGVVTEFAVPNVPPPAGSKPGTASTPATLTAITAGPDGALWFTFTNVPGEVGRITTAGVVTEFAVPEIPPPAGSPKGTAGTPLTLLGITAGPDGSLWFGSTSAVVGRITTAGVVTEFPTPGYPEGCVSRNGLGLKLRAAYFGRQLGLLTLEEFCMYRDRHGQARRVIPRNGATLVGVARCETRTPVNVGN